jgi:hypothetical protein
MMIVEKLEYLSENITGSLIVIGGMSKYLNGYREELPTGMIDISVTSDTTSSLEMLGERRNLHGGTTFMEPIKDQFILKTDDHIFDVFVQDEPTDHSIVGSLKVITPQADLNWHLNMSGSVQSDHLHNKIQSLKELYGL